MSFSQSPCKFFISRFTADHGTLDSLKVSHWKQLCMC